MPRIRFTADPKLPRDIAHLAYRKGHEADVSEFEARRWLRRGVAEIVEERASDAEPTEIPEPEIPEDWQSQHHMARIALARRLTDATVETAADADQVIAAEVERRAGA